MILQALYAYYIAMEAQGNIVRPGWNPAKVNFALVLDREGNLVNVIRLREETLKGNKKIEVPRMMSVPNPVKRSVNIAANFLCDSPAYFLGIDSDEKNERARKCFCASKELHGKLLQNVDSPVAYAIRAYFENWDPEIARENPMLIPHLKEILTGGNLVFRVDLVFAHEDPMIAQAWDAFQGEETGEETGRCLVTGEIAPIAKLHPSIKGVKDAQSSGAALVSFNASAFESYGKSQSYNAPVGKMAAFAYATALNALLTDRDHVKQLGDTTVVYWAESAEQEYQDFFGSFALEDSDQDQNRKFTEDDLKRAIELLAEETPYDFNGVELDPNMTFYVLGLSPNAARLSVRFFLRNSFGSFIKNLENHYRRLEIVKPSFDERIRLSPNSLLFETINKNAKDKNKAKSPLLSGALFRAVLNDTPYPESLFQNVMLRIRAEHGVTRGQAAIIKAVLLKQNQKKQNEFLKDKEQEGFLVRLDDRTEYLPYVLGRLFSVLESIQQAASPNLNTTIKDRYFTSACATPAVVYPTLLGLAQNHMKVVMRDKRGLGITLDKQLKDLMSKIHETFPKHLDLNDQGTFMLGYYHQTQKRYEKKDESDKEE